MRISREHLLYNYFDQLELLEPRFSEIEVTYLWHDAFTSKLTTSSIAYEKPKRVNQRPEIDENILHAPSTDLSLAQATKVFLQKSMDEKKNPPPPSSPKSPSKPPHHTSSHSSPPL